MDGTIAERGLKRARTAFCAVAGREHDAAMRRLLRDNPMEGPIQLSLEREPGYFAGANLAGAEDETILVFERGKLACMGRSSSREGWLDGAPAKLRYLAELRLDAAAAGRADLVRLGYRYFRDLHRNGPPAFQFTSIAADNLRARRLLESKSRGLPCYDFLDEFLTLLFPVPRKAGLGLGLERGSVETLDEIAGVLDSHNCRHQLGARWTGEMLRSLAARGLPPERFFVSREGNSIVACGAIWDQRAFRQTVIRGYAGSLRLARPMINLASPIFGTPRLPSPGTVLSHAFLSPLAFAKGCDALLPEFVASVLAKAPAFGLEFLTLGLPAADVRIRDLCKRFSPRVYRSRFYRVTWPGSLSEELQAGEGKYWPEIALL